MTNATQATEATKTPAKRVKAPADLTKLVGEVSEDQRNERLVEIGVQFDARSDFERKQHPLNDSIQDKLKAYRKKMAVPGVAAVLIAANVDSSFINRSITEGRRMNIYSIDKVNDLLHGLVSGTVRNGVNLAVMKSLFKFRAAGVAFNGVAAIAAVSDKVKVEKAIQGLLVRHSVSAATAPTQASSTLNALVTLGVVTNTGSQKFPLWVLTDTPVTARFEKILAA